MHTSDAPISAAEPKVPAALCPALDALWLECALRGLAALARGERREAARAGRAGLALCRRFYRGDPRRAASLIQLGLAARSPAEALARFARAEAAWRSVRATWLARLPAERAAGSSTFHLRLQRKHAGGYDHLRRAEYKRLCEAGRAAALGNLARVLIGLRRIDEAVAQLDEAVALRRAGFGGREAGVGALLDLRAAAARAGGRIDEAGRLAAAARVVEADPVRYDAARLERETGPRFDDPWRLRAALYLSPIPPALRPRA